MRTTKGWRAKAGRIAAATALVSMSLGGVAVADDISNNIDANIDATAEVMALNVSGANGTTTLYVSPSNGDGKNGCNLTGSTAVTASLASSNTGVATVSPLSVSFTSCSDTKVVTVTPVAAGSATVIASQTSNTTDGTFNLAPATFTVNVAPAANTAPSVNVSGTAGGASYVKGSGPAATCHVTDDEDGNSSFPAILSAISGPYASDGIGTQTASCSYTDTGGLTDSETVTYSIVDPSEPAISYTLTPTAPDGENGWYRNDVDLTWAVTESESPNSLVKTGCVDQNVNADQVATAYSCSATSAGGASGTTSVTVKRDGTAPTVTASGPDTNAWYKTDVTVTFTGTDATSGPQTQSQSVTSAGEGSAVPVASPAFQDIAGNVSPAGQVTEYYMVDKTAPSGITFVNGLTGEHYFGDVPPAPTCTATDVLSGLASCIVTGYSATVGTHTLTATATDNAGNTSTAVRSYAVKAWTLTGFYAPVDIGKDAKGNPIINTVKAGSTVPLKFEAFKGALELTDVSVVDTFTVQKTGAVAGPEDAIENYSTGGTFLRYDATGGQFIQNWQVPKDVVGATYKVTVTLDDGSTTSAIFKLK